MKRAGLFVSYYVIVSLAVHIVLTQTMLHPADKPIFIGYLNIFIILAIEFRIIEESVYIVFESPQTFQLCLHPRSRPTQLGNFSILHGGGSRLCKDVHCYRPFCLLLVFVMFLLYWRRRQKSK